MDDNEKEKIFPWGGLEKARDNLVPSDNDGQSPLHALLLMFCLPLALWHHKKWPYHYAGLVFCSFLCFFSLLTWHPWAARLHLPLFMLGAPLTGVLARKAALAKITAWILAACASYPLFFCLEHPLGPVSVLSGFRQNISHFSNSDRSEQYFNFYRSARKPYIDCVKYLASQKPSTVGLEIGDSGLEFPLWMLLRKYSTAMPGIINSPPYDATAPDAPEYIFKQHYDVYAQLPDPVVLKKTPYGYIQVYPPENGEGKDRKQGIWHAPL